MLAEKIEHPHRGSRREQIVAIDEADDVAAHLTECAVDRIGLPAVRLAADGVAFACKRAGNFDGAILRRAVLEPPAEVRTLRIEGLQSGVQKFLRVEHGQREHELFGWRVHAGTGSSESARTFHSMRGHTTPGHCSGKFDDWLPAPETSRLRKFRMWMRNRSPGMSHCTPTV